MLKYLCLTNQLSRRALVACRRGNSLYSSYCWEGWIIFYEWRFSTRKIIIVVLIARKISSILKMDSLHSLVRITLVPEPALLLVSIENADCGQVWFESLRFMDVVRCAQTRRLFRSKPFLYLESPFLTAQARRNERFSEVPWQDRFWLALKTIEMTGRKTPRSTLSHYFES